MFLAIETGVDCQLTLVWLKVLIRLVDVLRVELLGVVPDDEDVVVATNRGEPLVGDSKSLAGQAYMNVCRRITGEQVPFLDLDAKKGLFGAIAGVFKKK